MKTHWTLSYNSVWEPFVRARIGRRKGFYIYIYIYISSNGQKIADKNFQTEKWDDRRRQCDQSQ